MAIAPIPSYPMPTRDEMPDDPFPWRPDPRRAALLVHDMQRYFVRPFADDPGWPLVAAVARVRACAEEAGMPVFYTAQPGDMSASDRGLQADLWGPGMGGDEADRGILPSLAPRARDTVLTKWRYSAFAHTGLAARLRLAGRDQLIITGVYAHLGCQITATDAFCRDIETFMVGDALGDFSRAEHDDALRYVAGACSAVVDADSLTAHLNAEALNAEAPNAEARSAEAPTVTGAARRLEAVA